MTVKTKFILRIAALILTIVIFSQLSVYYFAQLKANDLWDATDDIRYYTNQLSDITLKNNKLFLEQLKNHQNQLDTYYDLFEALNNKLMGFEDALSNINENISVLNERYERLDYLYNQINTQTKTDNIENNEDMRDLYYGRLYIPSANINVALYYGWQQYITDRVDSANIFSWRDYDSCTIADHNNQEFAKLFDVEVGATGYIELKSGKIINIECVDIFNGHNNGHYIINEYGVNTVNKGDYIMYTCIDYWTNVRICIWNIV